MSDVELKMPLEKQKILAQKEGKTLAQWQRDTKVKLRGMRVVAVRSYKRIDARGTITTVDAERFQKKMDSAIG